jgi:cysteine-rich repeat protein
VCDAAEHCTGSSVACPADGFQPDDTPCDDANTCSINDRCLAGTCGGFLENCGNGTVENLCAEDCDDGNLVPGDGCDESCRFEPCRGAPLIGCRATTVAGKASVQIISRLNSEKNRLQWKYTPGAATPKADFGNPTTTTSYQFCVWEEIGGDPRLSASYAIPASGTCGFKPCWKESSGGFKYSDKAHTSAGISSLLLKQGLAPGKTKIILGGKGANMSVPVLPLIQSPNVVMQLISSDGVCWETRYGMPAFRNQPDQFRDK